mgnify:CR=1 FL=1
MSCEMEIVNVQFECAKQNETRFKAQKNLKKPLRARGETNGFVFLIGRLPDCETRYTCIYVMPEV